MRQVLHLLVWIMMASISTAWALAPEAVVRSFSSPKVVRGTYTQTHNILHYPKNISTEGRLVIVPKRLIMWIEQGMFPTKTIYRDSSFHIYQEINLDRVFRISNPVTNIANRLLWAFFSGDFIGLRQDFIIDSRQTDDRWTMDFYPKSSLAKAVIKSIHAEGSPLPNRIEYVTVAGDKTILEFFELVQNGAALTSEENALANP